jgi:lysine/ornithine N-monooxygenase
MTDVHDALVIGAGPAGLATSRELTRAGVRHLVLERGRQVGHTWAQLYDGLVLHTTRGLSALPGLAFPRGTPRFPTREGFLAYLHEYARTFSIPVRTDTDVIEARPASDLWQLRTADGATFAARAVVVATGIVSRPYLPELPGHERFGGRVIHAVEYRRPDAYAGMRVLVVGAGNSAADIAVELARAGIDVTVAMRSGATVVPLEIAGVPSQYFGAALALLPRRVQSSITAAMGSLSRALGREVIPARIARSRCPATPIVGGYLSSMVRSGAVRLRTAVAGLTPGGVCFDVGPALPIDTVILATGYRAAVDFLGNSIRLNSCGFPERSSRVDSADHSDLYFIGHTYDLRGALYNIRRDARVAAARVRARLDGRRRRSTEIRRPHNER